MKMLKILRHPTLKRWIDILVLALIGAIFFAYLSPRLGILVYTYVILLFGRQGYLSGQIVIWLFAVVLIVYIHSLARTKLQHVRHLFRYPPLPVALLLVLLVALMFPAMSDGLLAVPRATWMETACIATIYLFLWGFQVSIKPLENWINRTYPSAASTSDKITASGLSDSTLKQWLGDDDAIADSKFDFLGHATIADRLVERLWPDEATIALQGDWGSGKTSVCRMAEAKAKREGLELIFVFTSCWGFEEAIRTQKEVLQAILSEVGKEVDCLSIHRLPDNYVDAVASQAGWLTTLFQLGDKELSPIEQLQRLSPILEAIGKKVVVVIEDVDRTDNSSHVNQIQAMLMQFREVKGLSFILAISPLQQVDFVKICDHLEIMPSMGRNTILRLIHQTREMMLREYPPEIMLTELHPLDSMDDNYKVYISFLGTVFPWQYALCGLLNRPRLLKHALRRLCEAWPRLKGEVYLDDLLSVAALRAATPKVYEFLCHNVAQFRDAIPPEDKSIEYKAKNIIREKLKEDWQRICNAYPAESNSAATILGDLFPATEYITGVPATNKGHLQSMQSGTRGDIYVQRLFSEYLDQSQISDQEMLELIQKSNIDSKSLARLATVITDSPYSSLVFQTFAHPMKFGKYLPLASEIYAVIRMRHGAQEYLFPPGILALMRLTNGIHIKGFDDWVVEELKKCIPWNLPLLSIIYDQWLGSNHSYKGRERPRREINSLLRVAWNSMLPQDIAAGFDSSFPYTLFHIIFTSDYKISESVPFGKIEDWAWSGKPLLNACRKNPDIILPQILIALEADSVRGGGGIPQYEFDKDRLIKWFGNDAQEVLLLAAQGCELDPEMSEESKMLLRLAFEKAREIPWFPPDSAIALTD